MDEIFTHQDGKLFWKIRPSKSVHIGDEAGTIDSDGYRNIRYKGLAYRRHRLIYFMYTGEWPPIIDHLDQSRDNDKFENLRPASACLNSQNSSKIRGLIPFRGVSWHKQNKKFVARFMLHGSRINLGSFNSMQEASEAYQQYKQIHTASLL